MDDLESMISDSMQDEEEDEMLDMLKRSSVMTQRTSATPQMLSELGGSFSQSRSPQARVSFANAGLSSASSRARGTLQLPDEVLGSISEKPEEPSVSRLSPSKAYELRQRAESQDMYADRYAMLIQHCRSLVAEVKSALYDADHAGHRQGAEVLLDEVRVMLADVSQKTLAEAAQLQRSAEQWLGHRRKMAAQLQANHARLEGLMRRRAESARESNEESRADCDRLWRQIREWEAELESLPKLRAQGALSPLGAGSPLSPMAGTSPQSNKSMMDPVELGGLTLEGAHSLLRAFASVLQPHMATVIPKDSDRRSPSEAVALEFLTACSESMQQASSTKPFLSQEPSLRRCGSTPAVIFGDRVESTKQSGLLPLPVAQPSGDKDRLTAEKLRPLLATELSGATVRGELPGLLENLGPWRSREEEQHVLQAQLGETF